MQIEVIGNLRIKCTLTSEYLKSRWVDIDDLAYGTEAMTALFRDIIEETREKFGIDFTARENHPVMIEAVPMGEGTLTVFISKAEDAEELDTRFSRFSPKNQGEGITPSGDFDDEDDYMDAFDPDDEMDMPRKKPSGKPVPKKSVSEFGRSFFDVLDKEKDKIRESGCIITVAFERLTDVMDLASKAGGYEGESSVYKNRQNGKYLLVVPAEGEDFAKAMNFAELATEFGKVRLVPRSGASFLDTGYDILVAQRALEKLAQ